MLRPSRNVVLFSPPYSGKLLGPPLGLLSLAASLREAGYVPRIIDGALHKDYKKRIADEIEDCLCFGVSLLTGPMIHDAIGASRLVRRLRPDLPIIFGGWHPSLLPRQTLQEDFVDVVVLHQGDKTLVEIADRLSNGNDLHLIPGCWFKHDGRIYSNSDRPATALSTLPSPAFDLVDFDSYAHSSGERKLPYATSIGCPYACNYCTDMVFYSRRFNPLPADHVVGEVTELVERHRLTDVALVDSNFLVDIRRAVAIANGFLHSGRRFRWTFQASTDLLCRMTDDEVELLAASGVSHIGFGTESASPEVLRWMNKAHQHIPDISEAARKCHRSGIRVTFNLIFAYPGEQESHRRETFRVMGEIASRFDNINFSPNILTPYPGIPLWPELKAHGLSEPASLREWADVELGSDRLPWLGGKGLASLKRSLSYFLLDNQLNKARWRSRSRVLQTLLKLLRRPLHWRLRHHCFNMPVELWFSMARQWLVMRRSLLTGQALGHSLTGRG